MLLKENIHATEAKTDHKCSQLSTENILDRKLSLFSLPHNIGLEEETAVENPCKLQALQ